MIRIDIHDVKELFIAAACCWLAALLFAFMPFVAFGVKAINAIFGLWRWERR